MSSKNENAETGNGRTEEKAKMWKVVKQVMWCAVFEFVVS
jgi:hypothetical protein